MVGHVCQRYGWWNHSHGCSCHQLLLQAAHAVVCAASCIVVLAAGTCLAQASVEELRNSYSFLQVGLSTLAAGASVALCLARGRLDSEMSLGDLLTMTRFRVQNDYGSKISHGANNGCVMGVFLSDWSPNVVKWIAHNTWAQGNITTLVSFCIGHPSSVPPSANSTPSGTQTPPPCTCWHIPSIQPSGRGGLASLHHNVRIDPQCYRVPSYQCQLHGQAHMPSLHQQVLTSKFTTAMALEGPSQLVQWMLEEKQRGEAFAYFFGIDNLGAQTLKRMVSESMATQDASEKGRTSDLVDWCLGKLDISEKPDVTWKGQASTVVLVSLLEVVLMLVLCCVFGLDPFVSSLGARRGVRSLRLGAGGVTVFADLWLLEVKGCKIQGWENTPVLRVTPRKGLWLWYFDVAAKVAGLIVIFASWIAFVLGYAHPLGLKRSGAWRNSESWAIYVGSLAIAIGFFTTAPSTGLLDRFAPTMRRGKGFHMLRFCWAWCMLELALSVLRLLHGYGRMGHSRSNWLLLPSWYVAFELGVWLQWLTARRSIDSGPHSESRGLAWALTLLQAGAYARATILSAVSGSWSSN